jgi:hypothetical protein
MMKKISLYFLAAMSVVAVACDQTVKSEQSMDFPVKEKDSMPLQEEEVEVLTVPDWEGARFSFKDLCEDEFGNPHKIVRVDVDGKTVVLDTVMACNTMTAKEYASHDIPSSAIDACGGWWAGAGDYFYLIEKNNRLLVYQGWLDEGQEDESYHWKKVKEFK